MRIVLFAAILLAVVSVPAAYASTLQLVTENGNVFSIDFDEILRIWDGYNPSNQTQAIKALQQQFANFTAGIIPITNSTSQQDINDLQTQVTDFITQLDATRTNSTATNVLIDGLQDRIDILTDQLNSAIVNSTATEIEIDVLQNTIDTLTNDLDELESTLEDKIEDIDGVGAGALGTSGRVVTIPLQGILTYGTHTGYYTSGTVSPSVLFHHDEDPIGWAALIQDDDTYVEYDIPNFGEAFTFDSTTQTLGRVVAGDKVYVTGFRTLDGAAQPAFNANGVVVSGNGLILLELDNERLGSGETIDVTVPSGSEVKVVSSPNDLYNTRYQGGEFVLVSTWIRNNESVQLAWSDTSVILRGSGGGSGTDIVSTYKNVTFTGRTNYYERHVYSIELYTLQKIPIMTPLDVYVTGVSNSWRDPNYDTVAFYGQCQENSPSSDSCDGAYERKVYPNKPPIITSSSIGNGLSHITGIQGQVSTSSIPAWLGASQSSSHDYFTQTTAPSGYWIIMDSNPWAEHASITTNQSYQLTSMPYNQYLVIDTSGGDVTIQGNIVAAATGEITVLGLPAHTPWSINAAESIVDVGMTDSQGSVIVPRAAKEGVTATRHANYTSAPDVFIPDRSTTYDTITVTDHGTADVINVGVGLSSQTNGKSAEIILIAPDETLYVVKRSNVNFRDTYHIDVPDIDINGIWTIGIKRGASNTLQEWTLGFKSGTSSLVSNVNGAGSQYAVTVNTSGHGLYELGMSEINGITDSAGLFLDDSLQTGPDETHDAGSGNACPGVGFHVCSIERHNPTTERVSTSSVEYLVTFNDPATNVDASDFVSLRSITTVAPKVQNTAFNVWHEDEQATPATSNIYVSYVNTITSAKLILNASSPNGQYGSDWSVNLTAPGGRTMVITDASTSQLNNAGGGHEYYLGEVIGWDPPNGNWVLSAIDEEVDDDPINSGTDDPEGQIDSWSLEFEHGTTYRGGSVGTVRQDGAGGDKYVVPVTSLYSNYNGYMLWLKGDNDIESQYGSDAIDPRVEFEPNPHEGFNRGSVSIPSTPHIRGITVANSTSNSAMFLVTFSETVTGVDASDFVAYRDGISYGPTIVNNAKMPNIQLHSDYGMVEDTITIFGYDENDTTVVVLNVNATHTDYRDLRFSLISPSGTVKIVSYPTPPVPTDGNDLVYTYRAVDFGSERINGKWTLRVEDYTDRAPIQKLAFLNEWAISMAYQAEPTYDELQKIALDIGDVNAFAPLPESPHTLRLYPDALSVVPIRSDGVLFDTYHDGIIEFVPASNNNVLFTSNAYIRYPMTVEVYIADVRLSSESDCSNALNLARDGLYQPGDLLMIPVLPGTSVLCMNIAGSDVVIHLEDVLAQSIVSSIPASQSDGRRATSGTSTFISQDGTITVTVTASMRSHFTAERSFDYNDAMAHTGNVDWASNVKARSGPVCGAYVGQPDCDTNPRPELPSNWSSEIASLVSDASNNYWDRWRTATTMSVSGDRPMLTMNVYRNGELLETQQVFGLLPRAELTVSNFARYSMDQSISTTSEVLALEEVITVDVKKGDFVQVEFTADANLIFNYPGRFLSGYSSYPYYDVGPCRAFGVGGPGSACYSYLYDNSWREWSWDRVYMIPLYPDAKPIINSTQSKQVEIIGGYVIFAGN